jgi:hypothetical protein
VPLLRFRLEHLRLLGWRIYGVGEAVKRDSNLAE